MPKKIIASFLNISNFKDFKIDFNNNNKVVIEIPLICASNQTKFEIVFNKSTSILSLHRDHSLLTEKEIHIDNTNDMELLKVTMENYVSLIGNIWNRIYKNSLLVKLEY